MLFTHEQVNNSLAFLKVHHFFIVLVLAIGGCEPRLFTPRIGGRGESNSKEKWENKLITKCTYAHIMFISLVIIPFIIVL